MTNIAPSVCKKCNHVYWQPCHGQSPTCPNIGHVKKDKKVTKKESDENQNL